MRTFQMVGLALMVGGAIGFLAAELVAPAYASRDAAKSYVLAFSTGRTLVLERKAGDAGSAPMWTGAQRNLSCRHVVGLIGARIGYNCH